MAEAWDRKIVLFGYMASPYYRKIRWYLTLRGLSWSQSEQPVIMPRPDLARLGVAYRRIPLLAIGKDVYADTRIILLKLEELFPENNLSAPTPEGQAIQKLLEVWHVEGPIFWKAVQCMPTGAVSDPAFVKDRTQLTGRPFDPEESKKIRPESMQYVQSYFSFLEKLLADGREWLVNTDKPTLADVEGIYTIHWIKNMPSALPDDVVSAKLYPKVFAWFTRFDKALEEAKSRCPEVPVLDGETLEKQVLSSNYAEPEGDIPSHDPVPLSKGDNVELFPSDYGFLNKDKGKLLKLRDNEICIALETGVRLHTPRQGFRVLRQNGSNL